MILLDSDEPAAWHAVNPDGSSPYLIICDHAGRRIPRRLRELGLSDNDRQRHIAWDIGAAELATALGHSLDACVILQTYSRLVIDCNRPLGSPGSIVVRSEDTAVTANVALAAEEIAARQREIFVPYHERVRSQIQLQCQRNRPVWLICLHSFTPVFRGVPRSWHCGVLYNRDTRLARALLATLGEEPEMVVGDNEPYAVSDTTDYAIPVYGEGLGLPHVGIEIRQDLIADAHGQAHWSQRLARILRVLQEQPRWLSRGKQ